MSATEHLIWYCRSCRKACKSQPDDVPKACRCETPVMPLTPTTVAHVTEPVRRPVRALSDREAHIRGVVRPGRRVRITLEADVDSAWVDPATGQVVFVARAGRFRTPVAVHTEDPSVTVEPVTTKNGDSRE